MKNAKEAQQYSRGLFVSEIWLIFLGEGGYGGVLGILVTGRYEAKFLDPQKVQWKIM